MNKGGVQPTGEDLGRLTVLAAPAADGWRWAAAQNESGDRCHFQP